MSQWFRAIRIEECLPGTAIEVVVGEQIVAIYNVEGDIIALDGICPHQGGPLGKGELAGCIVTCPWHGWQFDVRTGRHLVNASVQQPCIATRVKDCWIEVELSGAG